MSVLYDGSIYQMNSKNVANGLDLLKDIQDGSIATCFFDPQYRGVLDKLKYGNEGNGREIARCNLPQMDEDTIIQFIREIDRVLKDSGHLFLWIDKFHICQGVSHWSDGTSLNLVDLMTWNKRKIGMGHRTRHTSEHLVIFQKKPVRAKGRWTDHSIPDVWAEKVVKNHPHSKPLDLQRRLIEATTQKGEVVLDPASGGYSVLEACKLAERNFIGCDLLG